MEMGCLVWFVDQIIHLSLMTTSGGVWEMFCMNTKGSDCAWVEIGFSLYLGSGQACVHVGTGFGVGLGQARIVLGHLVVWALVGPRSG